MFDERWFVWERAPAGVFGDVASGDRIETADSHGTSRLRRFVWSIVAPPPGVKWRALIPYLRPLAVWGAVVFGVYVVLVASGAISRTD